MCFANFIRNPCYLFYINQNYDSVEKLDANTNNFTRSDVAINELTLEPEESADSQVSDLLASEDRDNVSYDTVESDTTEDVFFDSVDNTVHEEEEETSMTSSNDVYSKNLQLLQQKSITGEENFDLGNNFIWIDLCMTLTFSND